MLGCILGSDVWSPHVDNLKPAGDTGVSQHVLIESSSIIPT